jgi:glycosyltransferase involved in cell wall biosynthesis
VNRPRIAYLVKRFPRLSETFVLNEFLELRRQGLDLRLFALMDPQEPLVDPAAAELVPEVTYLRDARRRLRSWSKLLGGVARRTATHPRGTARVAWSWLSADRSRTGLRHALEGIWLARELRRDRVDYLHAHFAHSPAAVAHFACLAGGPEYSITAHAKDLFTTPRAHIQRRARPARFLVSCTAFSGEYLRQVIGTDARFPVHVIYHGTDIHRFSPLAHTAEPGRILSIGRLVPKKGFDILIEALRILAQRRVDFTCDIVGDGPLRQPLESAAQRAGLAERVSFRGARLQDELVDAYRRASLFVLAPVMTQDGDRDGIPNVLVEAMACGLPVVSTRLSGIPELIEDGVEGLLVAPNDPDALAKAIERLLMHATLAHALGLAGRRKVEASFDLSRNTRRLAAWLSGEEALKPSPAEVTVV